MRSIKTKLAAVVTAGTLFAVAGVAYAYWTTTGSGFGSVTNDTANGTVTLHASWPADALFPGGSQTVSFTADNGGDTDLWVETISLDPTTPFAVDSGHPGCVLTDFDMDDVTAQQVVPNNTTGHALTATGTITFANDPANSQDDCKGATITMNVVSN